MTGDSLKCCFCISWSSCLWKWRRNLQLGSSQLLWRWLLRLRKANWWRIHRRNVFFEKRQVERGIYLLLLKRWYIKVVCVCLDEWRHIFNICCERERHALSRWVIRRRDFHKHYRFGERTEWWGTSWYRLWVRTYLLQLWRIVCVENLALRRLQLEIRLVQSGLLLCLGDASGCLWRHLQLLRFCLRRLSFLLGWCCKDGELCNCSINLALRVDLMSFYFPSNFKSNHFFPMHIYICF